MKKTLTKVLILGAVFLVAIGAIWFATREPEQEEIVYTVMDEATLPTVAFDFEGRAVNLQQGYTGQMNPSYIRDTLTPLPADRKVTAYIETYGTEVLAIGFELRTLDGERLVERSDSVDFTQEDTQITAVVSLGDLLENEQDYLLCVTLQTEKFEMVCYYTRVRYYEDLPVAEMISFAQDFSDRTFDKNAAAAIRDYLESDGTADDATLGRVTIKSSFDQVTWGDLAPVRAGDPLISVDEADETTASITLSYAVAAVDENGVSGEYQVEELFCLRKASGQIYLMDYERNMGQSFNLTQENLYSGVIELGVVSGHDLPLSYMKNGAYGAFSFDGELWEYNNTDNSAVRVFSFKQSGDDGIRTHYNAHDFKIIRLDDNGDMDFLVYGYMSRGPQEGQCGLAFYQYTREDNILKEVFYIPSDKPFEVMDAEVSMLSYIGGNELLYLVFDNCIYAIDFNGIEPVQVTSNLKEGSFAVSDDKSQIAWQEEESLYGCKTICVMYLDDGTINRIAAPEGEYLRVLDFIGNDFIYGFAREGDAVTSQTISAKCPMYALEIVDRNQEVQIRYEKEALYITGVSVENDRVLVRRASKEASGRYLDAASDSLIQNAEKEETEKSAISVRADEKRQRVYLLNFAAAESAQEKLSISTPNQVVAGEEATLKLGSGEWEDPRYFGYVGRHLVSISYSAAEAIETVYGDFGRVIDAGQRDIWQRLNVSIQRTLGVNKGEVARGNEDRLRASLMTWLRYEGSEVDVSADLAAGKTPIEILEAAFPGRVVDLEGSSVPQILYFLDNGHPVLALTEGTKAELIVGYDRYNLVIYNPLIGQTYKMARDDAASYYGNAGNVFVTIVD